MATTHKLAVILRNPYDYAQFLLVRQPRQPLWGDQAYDSYSDSDLWDLPSSAQLRPASGDAQHRTPVKGSELCSDKIVLESFDLDSALSSVLGQAGFGLGDVTEWSFVKYAKEADFGPGSGIDVVFVEGKLLNGSKTLEGSSIWANTDVCMDMLVNVKPGDDRLGPLAVIGALNQSLPSANVQIPSTLVYQEYPPGVVIVPMGSHTGKPFHSTNLVVFAPKICSQEYDDGNFIASSDALIVDPGCRPEFHEELSQIVNSLPRKLIVFLTHHHRDHVDALPVVQKCNPDAMLLAHENTIKRITKDDWSSSYVSVCGADKISVCGQGLTIIFSPGHTDGHLGLLHNNTNSLIVGDHCVGQGSAVLDISSGGKLADYYESTYKFMELSPHILIPMHGRVNLWPKHMLCGYLRNRRDRESAIVKAIEAGATSLFDIVCSVYAGVDYRAWPFASRNVRAHVEYLAQLNKLPKDFDIESFNHSFDSFDDELDKIRGRF